MSKTELETIVLDCLARLETEAKTARKNQCEKIGRLENRMNDFDRQLTRLSRLYMHLESLVKNLDSILSNSGRR